MNAEEGVRFGHATDPGRLRSNNEDAFLAEHGVFAVADGMGGQAAGEVASAIAVSELASLEAIDVVTVSDVVEAIHRANRTVLAAAYETRSLAGMGTTLVGLVAVEHEHQQMLAAFNLGDSRIYLLDGSGLRQLSTDHSEVQALLDAGRITADEARIHPSRHVITRAIGAAVRADPDLWVLPRRPGDRFLLCSDGLTNELDDEEIADLLRSEELPAAAAEALVRAANAAGGRDNITTVVVDVLD